MNRINYGVSLLLLCATCFSGCELKQNSKENVDVQVVVENVDENAANGAGREETCENDEDDNFDLELPSSAGDCPITGNGIDKSMLSNSHVVCKKDGESVLVTQSEWVHGNNRLSLNLLATQSERNAMVSSY